MIEAFRITDFMLPMVIMADEAIAAYIYEDGAMQGAIPNVIDEYWVGVNLNGNIAACYRIHQMGRICWQLHARILPEYRLKHAVKISTAALKWAAENIKDLEKIICTIPHVHRNVILHARRVGLEHEGTVKGSYLKDKQIVNTEIYSISKGAIRALRGA